MRRVIIPCGLEPEVAAVKRPKRLFTKNTGLCEVVRRRIGADACPVPAGYAALLATSVAKQQS